MSDEQCRWWQGVCSILDRCGILSEPVEGSGSKIHCPNTETDTPRLKWKWLSRRAYLGKLSEYIKFVARAWQAIWTPKIWMTRIDLVQNLNKNSILDGWSGLCQTVISVMISKCFYTYCDASRFLLIERDLYKDPQSIDGLSYVLFLVWNTEYGRCIEIRKSFDKSFSKDYSKHM